MKVAILYSGLPKFDQSIYHNHKKYILDIYKPDIYISTYDADKTILNSIETNYQPKTMHIENYNEVEKLLQIFIPLIANFASETKPFNVLSMHYKMHKSFSFLDNNYDVIIRNRFDNVFDQPLELIVNDKLNIPKGGDHRGGLMDLFAYGNSSNMFIYNSLILFLGTYLIKYGALFHPEILLRMHCQYNNIDINRFDFNIYLRNILFTQSAPTYY